MKLAVFYHCLIQLNGEVLPVAINIIREQMALLESSGLLAATSEFIVGINGDGLSREIATLLIPPKARIVMHGSQCRNECRSIRLIEEWLPGHEDWIVLYAHAKGATRPANDPVRTPWRRCMEKHLIKNWRQCVSDLNDGYEAVGNHWMVPPATPPGQYIFAGTFWWAKASFLRILPSIMERERIKMSGIDSLESRYEVEIILGNGPRLPKVKDYCPGWTPGKPHAP